VQPKITVLGIMSTMPVAGVVWQTLHYLVGLRRLGCDVHYVETHGRLPAMLMSSEHDDGPARAASFIERMLRPFDMGDRWAYVHLDCDRRDLGMSRRRLQDLYASSDIILNLHGGTEPLDEFARTGRLVYLETDPVQLQVELAAGERYTTDFLEPHCAFFSFGEKIGADSCTLPAPERFAFVATRQPVVLDFWPPAEGDGRKFTSIGNFRQAGREVSFAGDHYTWSKHHEWEKVLDLPRRTGREMELALSRCWPEDRRRLEGFGWSVVDALAISMDMDPYRRYITHSHAELTVAKDQNVRFRTGWFSDRSATYLAAGRPVVTQETGFSEVLPTGRGLFAFSTAQEAAEAFDAIDADYAAHRRGAVDIAREFFSADVVLRALLDRVGVELVGARGRPGRAVDPVLPEDAVLQPVSRRPTVLPDETAAAVTGRPSVRHVVRSDAGYKLVSVVMVTYDAPVFTRLALDSVLACTDYPSYEVVVVDNGSDDATLGYLRELADLHPPVRLIENGENRGFPAATNQGIGEAAGDVLVLLNNDVLVAPGWMSRLVRHLEERGACLVGPVTNRIGNEAEIRVDYTTWGGFLDFARHHARGHDHHTFPIHTLTMFCLAMPRAVVDRIGVLDEQFGVGTLEDDDYSMRARLAGLPLVCAEDVVVHHFGESSFGDLVASGERDRLLGQNRRRFAAKWGEEWRPYGRGPDKGYAAVMDGLRRAVDEHVPAAATVLVVSRGDDALLRLGGRPAWHFPRGDDDGWAGHYPADGAEAVRHLEELRRRGGQFLVVPQPGLWWLDHYGELREHLETRSREIVNDPEIGAIFSLETRRDMASAAGADAQDRAGGGSP
jgi:GT2 family glycosyltransferase